MKIKIVLIAACLLLSGSVSFAQKRKTVAAAPEQVVKNLYAARKTRKTDPFFQKKNRAPVDKYFTKGFADLIWKDALSVNPGEVGALDFDPLFDAQDMKITNFVIGKADESGAVKVTFKNFGKDDWVKFYLIEEPARSKAWKIDNIMYSDAEDLRTMFENAAMTDAERDAAEKENKLDGDYLVGGVKCSVTTNTSGYYARVKCDDQENFQVVDTESLTFGTFDPNEKGRKGKFVKAADGSISEFIDASGKKIKVTRVK